MRKKIKKLKTSDPKEYWKLLNKGRDRKQPNIPLGDLFKFFYIGFILPTSQMSGITPELKIALNIFS
jgi:hypothetical protein